MLKINTKLTLDNFKVIGFKNNGANCHFIEKDSVTKVWLHLTEKQFTEDKEWRNKVSLYNSSESNDIFGRYVPAKTVKYLEG